MPVQVELDPATSAQAEAEHRPRRRIRESKNDLVLVAVAAVLALVVGGGMRLATGVIHHLAKPAEPTPAVPASIHSGVPQPGR
jgi:hypothetical protein